MNRSALKRVLIQYDVHIAEAEDLVVLQSYEIVLICDDSGSMSLGTGAGSYSAKGPSRWSELKDTVSCIVELGACFDASGIDIYFLNRPAIHGVKSIKDSPFVAAFEERPRGTTPLTETLRTVAQEVGGSKPARMVSQMVGLPNSKLQSRAS